MERYKKNQFRLLVKLVLGGLLMTVLYLTFYRWQLISAAKPSVLMQGGGLGALIGYFSYVVWYAVRVYRIFHNPDFLEKLQVRDNDERALLIGQKTGYTAMQIILVVLVFVMEIFGALNETVFFTLYFTLIFVLAAYFFCYLYFCKKY